MSFELYSLVHSFSAKEKIAFKQFSESSKNTETNHAKLFEAYCETVNLNSDEDEGIRKKIGVSTKNAYSKCKGYLQEWLFRFLRDSYANKDEKEVRLEIKMTNLYLDILILMELRKKNNINRVLHKKIEEAKEFASNYYFFLDLIKILHIQKFLLRTSGAEPSAIFVVDKEIATVYEGLQIEHNLVGRYDKLYELETRQDIPLLEREINRSFEYINNLHIPKMTLRIKMTMHYIKEKYYTYIKDDFNERTKNLKDTIEFIVSNQKLLNDQQDRYLNLEMNYINSLVVSNTLSQKEIITSNHRISLITPKNKDIEKKIEQFKCYCELQFFFGVNQFEQVVNLKEKVEVIIRNREAYQLSASDIFVFQYILAFSYFIVGKTKASAMNEAQSIALTIRNNYALTPSEELRNEFLLAAIALEKGLYEQFEHYCNRIKYIIDNATTNSYDVERELLHGLKQLLNRVFGAVKESEKANLKHIELKKLHDKLKNPLSKDYREFLYWMHPAAYPVSEANASPQDISS